MRENTCDGRVDADSLLAFLATVDFCAVPGCTREVRARGWCINHYERWRKHGDPLINKNPQRPRGLTEAEAFAWFMPGDPPTEGCWDWQGHSIDRYGYGYFIMKKIHIRATNAAYRIYHGPTQGLGVLHSCDRPICVQPNHLSLGDQAINMGQARLRGRTARGERCGTARLTEAQVLWVREQNRSGMTLQAMADAVGVSAHTVRNIRLRKNWQHL